MTNKPTPKEMDDLFVEETGFDTDDFPAAIFDFARAVLAKWGQPTQAGDAVARLEIESLNAQLHAAKQINAAQFGLLAASIPGSALRASRGQASSQAGEDPPLVCDYCGALTPDPWHSSGMLHGKMSKHIHSCDACAARGAAEAQVAEIVPAPPPPPECETEAEKRAFAFGWFKAVESERMKAESVLEDAARYRCLRRWKGQEHEPPFTVQHEIDGTLWGGDLDAAIDSVRKQGAQHDPI